MNHIEAMKQALEALSKLKPRDIRDAQLQGQAWDALHQAIKQAEKQEPVAYPEGDVVGPCVCGSWPGGKCLKCPRIINAPPRDSWFKLTDAEVWDEWTRAVDESNSSNRVLAFRFARALEDKLKEKNA